MFSKYKITFKNSLPVVISVTIVIVIDVLRFINLFPHYNQSFRNFNHLIAAIIIPYILHTFKNDSVKFSCIIYAFGSLVWEFCEFCTRGYFQFDQYLHDLIGVAIIFLLYKFKEVS